MQHQSTAVNNMASHTTVLLSLAALVCLAALTLAAPNNFDDNGSMVFRDRRAAPKYSSGSRRGAASRAAPAYTAPDADEDEEDDDESAYSGEEHLVDLEPVTTAKPVKQSRVRPQRPVTRKTTRPQKPVVQEEEQEEQDEVEAQPMPGDGCVPYRAPKPQRPVTTPKPAPRPTTPKPVRSTTVKPTRAPKPQQQPEEEEEGHQGATAIASAVSQGEGAKSKSQAIALGGRFTGGQYRTRSRNL